MRKKAQCAVLKNCAKSKICCVACFLTKMHLLVLSQSDPSKKPIFDPPYSTCSDLN